MLFLLTCTYLSWLVEKSWPFWPLRSAGCYLNQGERECRLNPLEHWRFSKWANQNESFTSPWLQILNVPKMEVNVVMNCSLYSWRYTTDFISAFGTCFHPLQTKNPPNFEFLEFYTSPVDIRKNLHYWNLQKTSTNGTNYWQLILREFGTFLPPPLQLQFSSQSWFYLDLHLETGPISSLPRSNVSSTTHFEQGSWWITNPNNALFLGNPSNLPYICIVWWPPNR